jgi:hypothetical protein
MERPIGKEGKGTNTFKGTNDIKVINKGLLLFGLFIHVIFYIGDVIVYYTLYDNSADLIALTNAKYSELLTIIFFSIVEVLAAISIIIYRTKIPRERIQIEDQLRVVYTYNKQSSPS